jgi:hypothetical protein
VNRAALRLLFLTTLSSSGCGDAGQAATDALRAPVVGGEPSPTSDDAVVEIIVPETKAQCSGALVAPNVVVTALHCVARYDTFGTFSCDTKGVLITSSPPDGELGAPVAPTNVEIHLGALPGSVPDAYGAKVFGSGSLVICRNDLAFIVLDRDLDATTLPMRVSRPTRRGEAMRIVGYGQTLVDDGTSGRHARSGVLVSSVGANGKNAASGLAAPNTLVLGPGACHGDSGGPAVSEDTGAVVGVYSISAGISCDAEQVRNVYTQLAPFTTLADRAFAFAGKEPLVETETTSGSGGAGGAGSEAERGGTEGGRAETAGASEGGGHAGTEAETPREATDSSCAFTASSSKRSGGAAAVALILAFSAGFVRRQIARLGV